MGKRDHVLQEALRHVDEGAFLGDLSRRIASRTESAVPGSRPARLDDLEREMTPTLAGLGFATRIVEIGEQGLFRDLGEGAP